MSRVLVIDDDLTIRRQLCEQLSVGVPDVLGVANIADAEKEIAKGDVSVIIQDFVGVAKRAEEVFDFIKKHSGPNRSTETIAITGFLAPSDFTSVVDSRVFCFFKKPVDFDELLIATLAAKIRAESRSRGAHG